MLTKSTQTTIVALLALCLALTGCLGGANGGSGQQANRNGQMPEIKKEQVAVTGENPLQGLELDLAFMDAMLAMLQTNHMMLDQMTIDANAKWPSMLTMPDMEKETESAYNEWLDAQMKRDFSFFLYYGDVSINDFLSIKGFTERPIIEGVQLLTERILHQRQILDYRPDGCESPAIFGESEASKALCAKIIKNNRKRCASFNQPLEDQIFKAFMAKKGLLWADEDVNRRCLRTVTTKNKKGTNFETAFRSLLDPSLVMRYDDKQKEVTRQGRELSKLKHKLAELEMKETKVKDKRSAEKSRQNLLMGKSNLSIGRLFGSKPSAEEIKQQEEIAKMSQKAKDAEIKMLQASIESADKKLPLLKAEIKAQDEKVDAQEELFDQAVDAYELLLEEAEETIVVNNKNSVKLAKNLLEVGDVAYNNMGTAVAAIPLVLGKCGVDVCYLGTAGPQLANLPRTLAAEMFLKLGCKSQEEALKLAEKRVKLTLERSVMLVPNLFNTASVVYTQYKLTNPKIDYLEKVVDAGEDLLAEK